MTIKDLGIQNGMTIMVLDDEETDNEKKKKEK